jgi:hypothetical protein
MQAMPWSIRIGEADGAFDQHRAFSGLKSTCFQFEQL